MTFSCTILKTDSDRERGLHLRPVGRRDRPARPGLPGTQRGRHVRRPRPVRDRKHIRFGRMFSNSCHQYKNNLVESISFCFIHQTNANHDLY